MRRQKNVMIVFILEILTLFPTFIHTSIIRISTASLPDWLKLACSFDVKPLLEVCNDFVNDVSSRRSVLGLLRQLSFALPRLPQIVKFAVLLIEALDHETNFSFLSADEFELLISCARFTTKCERDDIIRKYYWNVN
jgi:hypothetical protein